MTKTIHYDDGRLPGGRRPRLYLAKGGEVRKFVGESIPGLCAITAQRYTKAGKWSSTEYVLDLAPGVRPIELVSPLHGVWGDGLASWGEAAERLGLPIEVAQAIVRAEYPKTAERLDQVEAFALAAEQQGAAVETVIVSFGAPTNRAIAEGYWSEPKSAQTADGRTVTVIPGQGPYGPDWSSPEVVAPAGAKLISARHTPGMHGGYWTVEVAVPVNNSAFASFGEDESNG